MANYSYLDRCVDIVAGIDAIEIGSRKTEQVLGSSTTTVTKSLGSITIDGQDHHLAIKKARPDNGSANLTKVKLFTSIAQACLIEKRTPELTHLLPKFMALIANSSGVDLAIVTEDATRGGELPIVGRRMSENTRRVLIGAFGGDVCWEEADRSASFDVGGNERILDFTPPLLLLTGADGAIEDAISETVSAVYDGKLSLIIPDDSVLALSL